MKNLSEGTDFWRDGEPLVLLGCLADVELDHDGYVFTNTGGFQEHTYAVVISGVFGKDKPQKRDCYAMYVVNTSVDELCWTITYSFSFSPPLPYFGGSCAGWVQNVPRFVLAASFDWFDEIDRAAVYSHRGRAND